MTGQSDKNVLFSFYNVLTSLRKAENKDCELLFNWANDATTRANAFNSNPIKFEDHKTWFDGKLKNENSYIYILLFRNIEIGQIRFDIEGDTATISYLIGKEIPGFWAWISDSKKGNRKL